MQDYKPLMKPRRERSVVNDYAQNEVQIQPSYSPKGKSQIKGIANNEYIVKDWETYFKMSTKQFESKLNTAKTNWCDRNFQKWIAANKETIEGVNVLKEVKV